MASESRRALIILAAAAAVVLALFFLGALHSPDDRGAGSGCAPARRDAWRDRVLGSAPVGPGQLSGCTTALGLVTIHESCDLTIAKAEARSRRLVITAVDPMQLTTITDADGRAIQMRAELRPGDDQASKKTLYVGKAGQTLTLRCTGTTTATCRARLE